MKMAQVQSFHNQAGRLAYFVLYDQQGSLKTNYYALWNSVVDTLADFGINTFFKVMCVPFSLSEMFFKKKYCYNICNGLTEHGENS